MARGGGNGDAVAGIPGLQNLETWGTLHPFPITLFLWVCSLFSNHYSRIPVVSAVTIVLYRGRVHCLRRRKRLFHPTNEELFVGTPVPLLLTLASGE